MWKMKQIKMEGNDVLQRKQEYCAEKEKEILVVSVA
jgi:hypothetical protein